MKILAYNPGHDGAIALVEEGKLIFSIEAEKDSNYRYSPISSHHVFEALGHLDEPPDIVGVGGWWPRDEFEHAHRSALHASYRGLCERSIFVGQRSFISRPVKSFSSSHERGHILCAYGMSDLEPGTPCYALVWEGAIGAFYEVDSQTRITRLANVMNQPGNRYALLYGLADPTFPKNAPFSRFSDAGKLMALASFSSRSVPTPAELQLMEQLLTSEELDLSPYDSLESAPHFNVGVDDQEFRNFAGIYSDKIFDTFYQFAEANLERGRPLIIAGGCGLNCDWNSKWSACGLFSKVFVPPVANDSGAAIGTAIDAQLYFTGNPKIEWSVYSGRPFTHQSIDLSPYDTYDPDLNLIADLLANGLILGWISGKWEIGPRALGNRSIIASPFHHETRIRLNEIKQREQFRPIAPMCLEEDAAEWFDCHEPSPFMLYTYLAKTDALAAVTHVNGSARIQTVSELTNKPVHELLSAFKKRTGYGVLCNTSLNFSGRGFINRTEDLSRYVQDHGLDGFVVDGRAYLLKTSDRYISYMEAITKA